MRNAITALAVGLALVVITGCGAGMKITSDVTASKLSVSEALTQAQGAATALATLAQSGPMNDATKTQMANYAAWTEFALKAAGILAPVAEAVVSGS